MNPTKRAEEEHLKRVMRTYNMSERDKKKMRAAKDRKEQKGWFE
jgi:hypothetical protein